MCLNNDYKNKYNPYTTIFVEVWKFFVLRMKVLILGMWQKTSGPIWKVGKFSVLAPVKSN